VSSNNARKEQMGFNSAFNWSMYRPTSDSPSPHMVDRDSSAGIVTRYVLDGPGIKSRCGSRFSASVQTGPGTLLASKTMNTGSFPGVKRPGRGVDHPPTSSAEVKSTAIPLLLPLAFVVCSRVNFTFTFTIPTYVQLK